MAFSLHESALIMLLLYPTYFTRWSKKALYYIIPSAVFVLFFNKYIFMFLMTFMGTRYSERYATASSTGAYTYLILMFLFTVYAFLIPDESKLDEEIRGLRNVLVICLFILLFAPIHYLAMRFSYYFLILIPLLVPKIANRSSNKYKQVAKVSISVMLVVFILYFLYNMYLGDDTLHIYPYVSFWK